MSGTQTNSDDPYTQAQRNRLFKTTSNLLSTLDRYEVQECLSFSQNHWMLSTDDFKIPTEPPSGLISQLTPIKSNENPHCWIMIPDEGSGTLDFKVLHQIIRELTMGIYVLNQLPSISLETNYDCSTSVQLPPAYIDTKVGQILSNIDYTMKALWHGSYIPSEKRKAFADRWRKKLDVDIETGKAESKTPFIMDFHGAGMIDITKMKDYQDVYSSLPVELPDDAEALESKRSFMEHVEDILMRMTVFCKSVQYHQNMFLVDGDWIISSVVKLTDDKMDSHEYERLQSRLRLQKNVIQENIEKKDDVKQQLGLLKFVAFLVPFLCALRRKMQIPDISKLLEPLIGDHVKTEREFPPLMIGEGYACKNFSYKDQFCSLHGGILINLESPDLQPMEHTMASAYDDIISAASPSNKHALDIEAPTQEFYDVPTVTVNGKRYFMLKIDLETYYPQNPRKPLWLKETIETLSDLKPKKLPITEPQMMEVYKKIFGLRKAIKLKNPSYGLKAAAQRGLVSIFSELSRKSQLPQLMKQDDSGLSLIHHAAMNNRPQIIAKLILHSMDVNARRNQSVLSIGPTALHLAARCGSLDAVICLCANYANIMVMDHNGWAPIHQAAYYNHVPVITMFVRKHDALLELATQNELKNTPLLLSSGAGALEAVICLINLGAELLRTNEKGHNIIHLAALRFHTNILEYFIKNKYSGINVWNVLVEMLASRDLTMQDASVRCMEILSLAKHDYWKDIKDHNGIPALVKLLKSQRPDIQSVAASVLCNISEEDDVRDMLSVCGASSVIINLLSSPSEDIQSRAAILMADIAYVGNNQYELAKLGAIPPLVALLESELEDVLVNSVNAIRVLCTGNHDNQTEVATQNAIEPLVEFLTCFDSDDLQAASAAAIASLCEKHKENQDKVRLAGAAGALVKLVEGRNTKVQVKAALAIKCMATDNVTNQEVFREDYLSAKHLIKLLKAFALDVKEAGAGALWAIAGHTKPVQADIARQISVILIIDMLLAKSEQLNYIGSLAMSALCRENVEYQNEVCENGGIEPLVRIVRSSKSSERVLLQSIETLGVLCVGVAHRNNKRTQHRISDFNAIPALVGVLMNPPSQDIQVATACTLAYIVLGNTENQRKLNEIPMFKYSMLLNLLSVKNENVRLQAGTALAVFGFNNTQQQYAIRESGGVSYSIFQPFLTSGDEFYRAHAAFQIVVLARVISDRDQVSLTAEGVTELVKLLTSTEDNVIILSASLLSSLAHTRAGIPDAMVTQGAIDLLISHLDSQYKPVRTSCAVALGYLSFNKTAAIKLLSQCRNDPDLYDKLVNNLDSEAKMSEEFKEDFQRARKIGLPSQSLMKNGGPPACPTKRTDSSRPKTSVSRKTEYRETSGITNNKSRILLRAVSAPAKSRTNAF